MSYPLEDLRVLDMSRVLSGPLAGRMLSDLGADVVKLEPPAGDISRIWGEVRHGLSGFFTQQNVGKRNVCVDLAVAGAAEIVRALAATADLLIENFRPGVMARYGLDWDHLQPLNPRLIMLSISGFGQEGPEAARPAYAPVIHAESGIIARQAAFDLDAPSDPVLSIADSYAGLHGLVAALAALHQRDRTGVGQWIDVSMLDAVLGTDDYGHHALDQSRPVRLGGGVWDAPGGPILIAGVFSNAWRAVSETFGLADPTPADADRAARSAGRRKVFGEWVLAFPERGDLTAALEMVGLAWGNVRAPQDAYTGPTAVARNTVAAVDDRGGGTRFVAQSPYRFSAASAGVRGPAAHRGEHNRDVLESWLGWDPQRIAAYEATGALVPMEGMEAQ